MDALQNMLRTIVFFVDDKVYGLISTAYEVIVYLANVNLFANPEIQSLVGRIYLLLGVFMLFKVSFSMIQYIIDPNAFNDSSKGFGKLATNVMVSLVLLITVPSIFNFAFDLQNKIILSNVIPNLIMGTSTGDSKDAVVDSGKTAQNMARDVQFIMFGAFFSLNTSDNGGIPECAPSEDYPSKNIFGSRDMAMDGSDTGCLNTLKNEMDKEGPVKSRGITLEDFFKQLKPIEEVDEERDNKIGEQVVDGATYAIIDNRNFGSFDAMLWWKKDGKPEYTINYTPFFSTIAGVYVLLILLGFCIDVAARALKLCFLQMIAPIAIVSYIDPKESVSQGKLRNWMSECLKTFFSLFLRLATIFLALKLVQIVTSLIMDPAQMYGQNSNYDAVDIPMEMNIWIVIALIIGIFTFAKQAPKMIESIFGIKLSGELKLNPFKAAGVGAALGTAVGLAGSIPAGIEAKKATGKPLAGLATAISGAKYGYKNHEKGGIYGEAMKQSYKDVTGNDFTNMGPSAILMGIGSKERVDKVKAANQSNYTVQKQLQTELGVASNRTNDADRAVKDAESRLNKFNSGGQTKESYQSGLNRTFSSKNEEELKKRIADLKSGTAATFGGDYDSLNAIENELKNREAISAFENLDTARKNYSDTLETENKLRGDLSAVESRIKKLGDEKAQEERLGHLDNTPRAEIDQTIIDSNNDPRLKK